MTLSIIAIGFSLLSLWTSYQILKGYEEEISSLNSRLKAIENLSVDWTYLMDVLGYKKEGGWPSPFIERKLTKWNALLDYLKIEWKEEATKARFEKIK